MNERLSEMVDEAGISIRSFYDETGITPTEVVRFTEIVVNKCCDIVLGLQYLDSHIDVHFDGGYKISTKRAVQDLKKYFGVKE